MQEDKVFFSIITVCYNSEKTIRQTIESVLMQEYDNYEFIVQDGKSEDGTLELVQNYVKKFEKKNVKMLIASEQDSGIYQAMNRAIHRSSGNWLIFLNSDDQFFSKDILSIVANILENTNCDVLYGDSNSIYPTGIQKREIHDSSKLNKKMSLCHQACFIKSDIMKKYMYNEAYAIGADYDFFLNVLQGGGKFEKVEKIICNFSKSGVSGKNLVESYKEFLNIHVKHGIKIPCRGIILLKLVRKRIHMRIWGNM